MKIEDRILPSRKSLIISADVRYDELYDLIDVTLDLPGIDAYKFGFNLALGWEGLYSAVELVKCNTQSFNLPLIIYDHQKAGNDIPQMGEEFTERLVEAGVDAVILFPFAGPTTQRRWTEACFKTGLQVIIGGIMTHDNFLASEGGYIADDAPERIFRLAASMGVRHYVVPGTKIAWVKKLKYILDKELGSKEYVLYAPGFGSQSGDMMEFSQVVDGEEWHAIIGSAIYKQQTIEAMRDATINYIRQIQGYYFP